MCIIIPRTTTKKYNTKRYSPKYQNAFGPKKGSTISSWTNSSAEDIIQTGSYLLSWKNEEREANFGVKYTLKEGKFYRVITHF